MKILQCPKCKADSGNDWSQCQKKCPVDQSPHFDPETLEKYGPLVLKEVESVR